MRSRVMFFGLGVLALSLVGASPTLSTDPMILAQEAIENRDYPEAARQYTVALERTNDPGLVSFNLAVVQLKQSQWVFAEENFRRSLADDSIPKERRAKALYNLGICMVKQDSKNLKRLGIAVECFELAQNEAKTLGMNSLKDDAADNLEIARMLWLKALREKHADQQPPDQEKPNPEPKKTPDQKPKEEEPDPTPKNKKDPKKENAEVTPAPKEKDKKDPTPDPKQQAPKTPGKGQLPVLTEQASQVTELTPEQTREYLRQAEERLRKERQKIRQESLTPDRLRPNDW